MDQKRTQTDSFEIFESGSVVEHHVEEGTVYPQCVIVKAQLPEFVHIRLLEVFSIFEALCLSKMRQTTVWRLNLTGHDEVRTGR
jgi:hypothetical protein